MTVVHRSPHKYCTALVQVVYNRRNEMSFRTSSTDVAYYAMIHDIHDNMAINYINKVNTVIVKVDENLSIAVIVKLNTYTCSPLSNVSINNVAAFLLITF
jgi:hypothetical protein